MILSSCFERDLVVAAILLSSPLRREASCSEILGSCDFSETSERTEVSFSNLLLVVEYLLLCSASNFWDKLSLFELSSSFWDKTSGMRLADDDATNSLMTSLTDLLLLP